MNNKKITPPKHSWVETADGSFTLFSEHFQEACHSTNGAHAETVLHYVEGCKIPERLKNSQDISILEVGFGLGTGLMTTLEYLENSLVLWNFLSLELDRDLVEWFRSSHQDHPLLKSFTWIKKNDLEFLECENKHSKITILIGDARTQLPKYINLFPIKWNAIYQDAFSPKKNPTLWTQEWFELLKKNAKDDVTLSTYSSSTSIRKSLVAAGWILYPGEKFGPKRSSTRAKLQGTSDSEIMLHLERSPTRALRDDLIEQFIAKK